MAPSLDAAQWQPRLDLLAREHGVPGAAFGVLRLDDDHDDGTGARLELATGVLHLGTGVPVTPDALFQVGSITKVWTTTLVMRLVDEGLLDLDAPVVERLPEFAVADGDAAAGITLRHLLTHTSGFDGDTFTDTGRGDDCLRAFVAVLTDSRQLFAPGTAWSYNNAAFVVAGRLVETVTGGTWDAALRERVIEPLGLGRTVTLPEERCCCTAPRWVTSTTPTAAPCRPRCGRCRDPAARPGRSPRRSATSSRSRPPTSAAASWTAAGCSRRTRRPR